MGKYVNNNKVTLTTPYDYDDAVSEIAALIGVGARDNGKYYLADICQSSSINPLSRCKPFRWNAYNFPNADERARVRGLRATGDNSPNPNNGFGMTPLVYPADYGDGLDVIHGVYEYKRPRGGEDEPSRILDFDGYYHNAGSPLKITFDSNAWKDDLNYVIVDVQHTSGTNWNREDCLLLHECLDNNNKERYFALLITGGGYSWLMPTRVSPYDMQDDRSYTFTIVFHEDSAKLSSYDLEQNPTVWKDINNVPEGTEMTIALVLSNTGYTGESLPANGYFGSLEFVKNSDRTKVKLASSMTLSGLTYSYQQNSWGSFVSRSDIGGKKTFEWKNVNELLTINTPSRWNRTYVTARVTINWTYGNVYNELHEVVGGMGAGKPLTYDVDIMTAKYEYNSYWPIPNGEFMESLFNDDRLWRYAFSMEYSSGSSIYLPVSVSLVRLNGTQVLEDIPVLNTTLQFNIA